MSTTSDGSPLWCPNCDVLGRVALSPERDRYSGKRSYKARCSACGYSINGLGSDGTQTKAADEWQSLCEHALAVKKQLLGETKMGLQLELDVTAFLGMTDWFDLDLVQPEAAGWYEVRFKMPEGERQVRNPRPQRRWWQPHQDYGNGHVVHGCFSRPVNVGEEYQEEDIRSLQLTPTVWGYGAMEWRGLTGPHPDLLKRKKIRVG